MLSLADTSIRMYRKKNGLVSLKLKSYLLVHSNIGFSLSTYLRNISCKLTLSSGQIIPMEASYTVDIQSEYTFDTMVHLFWAWGEIEMDFMRNTVGKLRVDYHLCFTGHSFEGPNSFELNVPLMVRTKKYKGL